MVASIFSSNQPLFRGSGGGEAPADYSVSNASEFNAIIALGSATLSGKVMEMAPGNYGSLTVASIAPSTEFTIRGSVAPTVLTGSSGQRIPAVGTFARVDKLILDACSKIRVKKLELVTSSWQASPSPAIQQSHICSDIVIEQNYVHSGYRGAVDTPHDVLATLPEYACVAADMAGGSVTALEITRPDVGSLVADGVHTLSLAEASGSGFSATMTVVGGAITATNLISGGTGYAMNIQRTRRVTFTGQQRMSDWLPYGIQTVSLGGTTATQGDFTVIDNVFADLSNAVKPAAPSTGGTTIVRRNSFYRVYQDYFSMGLSGATIGGPVYFEDNFGTLPFSLSGDAGDPHSDWFQLYMNDLSLPYTAGDWENVFQRRNIFIDGDARGGVQGNLVGDNPAGIAYQMVTTGNIIMSSNLPNGLSIDNVRDSYFGYNSIGRYDPTDPVNVSVCNIRMNDALGWSFLGGNTMEATLFLGGAATQIVTTDDSNVVMGLNGATIPYTDVFVAGTLPTTKDEAIAYFATKAPYTGKGAGRAGYVNWAAGTHDETMERPFIHWTALFGQTASSDVSSEWSRLKGGPLSKTISITGGTYQIADDSSGTGATVASSSTSTGNYRDKFIRINLTNGAGSSQTTTGTLTIDGVGFAFSSTTVSTATFPVVAFDGADRFVRSAGALAASDGDKLTIAFKAKFPASNPGANVFVFCSIAGTAALEVQLLTTGLLRINVRNAAGTVISQTNMSGSTLCDGGTHEILISMDTSQATAADGRTVYVDNVNRTSATGTWAGGSGVTIGYTRTTGAIQYSFGGNASTMLNGFEVHYYWMDITSRLDLTSPGNRTKFAPDLIGTTGNGVTGTDPNTFLVGNAAQWNDAGGVNWGSGAKYVAAAGSAVTDVSGSAWV